MSLKQLIDFQMNYSKYEDSFSGGPQESFNNFLNEFPEASPDFLFVNIQKFFFDFDGRDREGINQLLQMLYYHSMIKDIIEVKFV
jgi:hypothetical protein